MKAFPDKLVPQNRRYFPEYKFNRDLCMLRQKIVEYLYSEEKGGFDLRSSNSNGQYSYSHIDDRLIEEVRKELHIKGWKTKLAYGNTVLFIYENEEELPLMSEAEAIDD